MTSKHFLFLRQQHLLSSLPFPERAPLPIPHKPHHEGYSPYKATRAITSSFFPRNWPPGRDAHKDLSPFSAVVERIVEDCRFLSRNPMVWSLPSSQACGGEGCPFSFLFSLVLVNGRMPNSTERLSPSPFFFVSRGEIWLRPFFFFLPWTSPTRNLPRFFWLSAASWERSSSCFSHPV